MRQRMLRSTPSGLIGLGPENEIITAAIEKLRTQIAGKLDADVLFPELDTLMKEVTSEHWTFTTPGVMIAGTMIIFFIRLC
jgi:hypothetical protein